MLYEYNRPKTHQGRSCGQDVNRNFICNIGYFLYSLPEEGMKARSSKLDHYVLLYLDQSLRTTF